MKGCTLAAAVSLCLTLPVFAQVPIWAPVPEWGASLAVQPLMMEAPRLEAEADLRLPVRLENLSPRSLEKPVVVVERLGADGKVRQLRSQRLPLDLAPGESRDVELTLQRMTFEPGDRLRVRGDVETTTDRSAEIEEGFERLRRSVDPPAHPEIEERLEVRRREVGERLPLDGLVGLQYCTIFCLECANIGALICLDGIESMRCDCSRGVCEIDCRNPSTTP